MKVSLEKNENRINYSVCRYDTKREKGCDEKKNVTTPRPPGIIMAYLSQLLLRHHSVINYQGPQI